MAAPKNISVVTGANGAVGRYVALSLATRGWTVIGIGHGEWQEGERARWGLARWQAAEVNLASLRALQVTPQLLVHCAGSGSVAASFADPGRDFQRTVQTTSEVAEFVRTECPEARLVYPSSAAVYGLSASLPMHESDPLVPASPYGANKRMAEELLTEYARFFSLNVAVVRLFSIYGEGFRKQLLWDACNRIDNDEIEFFGTGDERRDWLHANDAAALIIAAAERASPDCLVVNGGFGQAVPVRDILSELFVLLGREGEPAFRNTSRPGDPDAYEADIGRAEQLGWTPTIHWREGLRRYVNWYRAECEHQ